MEFLTQLDLQQLTGYRRPSAQIRWLSHNGYGFDIRADGRPAVLAEQVASRHVSVRARGKAYKVDLEALDKLR